MQLSPDRYESFRIFQGRMRERYLSMAAEFSFQLVDANQPIELQQSFVRQAVAARLDLAAFACGKAEAS